MNLLHTARHICVSGKSGMGKTSYACRYINGSSHDRVAIFDHQGEFASRLGLSREQVATDYDQFFTALETYRVVAFDFTKHYGGQMEAAFEEFCEQCFSLARRALEPAGLELLCVCDELQRFCTPTNCPPAFKNNVEVGRRYNLDTLSMSQRPNAITAAIREQFTELVLFRLQDENSLKFAAGIGVDVERVKNLPPHEFLFIQTVRGDERPGKIKFPDTVPLPPAV